MGPFVVHPSDLGLPPEERLVSEDGLEGNLDYGDLRGAASWESFETIWTEEPELLERIANGDELYEDIPCYETLMLGVDVGVASTVAALLAAGCATYTSCVGGPGHREDHPLVVFWCPESVWPVVEAAALESLGVTVEGQGTPHAPGLMVHAGPGDVDAMRRFARAVASRSRQSTCDQR